MPDFSFYVNQQVLILIPVLWFITYLLKSTPHVPDWLIPWIMVLCGVIGSMSILGIGPSSVIQGVIVAAINTLGNTLAQDTVIGMQKGKGGKGGAKK